MCRGKSLSDDIGHFYISYTPSNTYYCFLSRCQLAPRCLIKDCFPKSYSMFLFAATPGGESCRKSPTYSPTSSSPSSPYFERLKNHNSEEDNGLCQKKSVLTKVKERAMKFRYSLSKRRMEDENVTPSWGVSLEDDEEEEEDPEYLGAPSN